MGVSQKPYNLACCVTEDHAQFYIHVCIHAFANKLSTILIIISGGQIFLRALLWSGHPTTNVNMYCSLYIVIFMLCYIRDE